MCHLNIRKHRPWAYILGFIELPYFGSEQFRKIYLVERICICICICIWINVFVFVFESMLNKIFVFVFVFEKSKFLYLYLYLYLIKRIWPQPCEPQLTNKPCTNGRLREKHNCTDGQVETSIPPFQLRWSGRYNNFLVLTGNVFLQLGLLVIDKGEEMTHWYWLQFIMTHKMCSTCSTSSQIRKDGIIQASLVVVFENIKGPTHLVEKVATT